MKYSYATVSLPTLLPAEACRVLSAAGFAGIEWKVGEAPHARTSNATAFLSDNLCTLDENVSAAEWGARLARDSGLDVVGLAPYVEIGDLGGLRTVLLMAEAAGAPQVRLQAPRFTRPGEGYTLLFDRFLAFLREAAPQARRAGVRLVIELHHKTIAPSVGLAMPLLTHFSPDDVGVIYDVGNMVYEGYEDYRIGLELLGPYLHHVHLKNAAAERGLDGRWNYEWARLDDGLVDVGLVLDMLTSFGYDGWVSLEDLSEFADSTAAVRYNANVLTALSAPGWLKQKVT